MTIAELLKDLRREEIIELRENNNYWCETKSNSPFINEIKDRKIDNWFVFYKSGRERICIDLMTAPYERKGENK